MSRSNSVWVSESELLTGAEAKAMLQGLRIAKTPKAQAKKARALGVLPRRFAA